MLLAGTDKQVQTTPQGPVFPNKSKAKLPITNFIDLIHVKFEIKQKWKPWSDINHVIAIDRLWHYMQPQLFFNIITSTSRQ